MSYPKSIGKAVDMLYELRQERLSKAKEVEELQKKEKALSDHIQLNMLESTGLSGARGAVGQVSLQDYDYAEVTDWDKYFAYIAKTKFWELIQKREGITALREIWETGKQVPGVNKKMGTKLHLSKVGGK